ncbi:MAG: carbamoyltransferase HypF [Gammaproteobacteria bacterium]|nr:carbamoyltransferase HypF [Gammaproteobacteria bacterium]
MAQSAETIRVRGLVQGVGFRPTVWRLARECQLRGDVRNDGAGVLIRVAGDRVDIDRFCDRLRDECPPLARMDSLVRSPLLAPIDTAGFDIVASEATEVQTGVVADAATCEQCREEIFDPGNRRYRYPFTNCTHCGPRLSIVRGIPYDRANTSMSVFPMCPDCGREYVDPADRRFHAQPNACPRCGPRVWLVDRDGRTVDLGGDDAVDVASRRLAAGGIVAIKGIGGFHLACDACNVEAVATLRARKRRYAKPFALMARDLDVVGRFCRLDEQQAGLMCSPAAPIVLLPLNADAAVADGVAPGQSTLGIMLPYSPLHHLLLRDWDRPLVMTSGNLSDEPQCIANDDASARLVGLADLYLLHDREIVNRVDDSVVRVMAGEPRLLRRARGYAPTPILLPPGFGDAPPVLALGGELKNTVGLLHNGQLVLSQHLGDLEDVRTADEYERTIGLYTALFAHRPQVLAVDLHPDYRSTRHGRQLADERGLPVEGVQHHHAHIASVLAENGHPADAGDVLGIALDGLGFGTDGTIWGGEFLRAGYCDFERLASLKPVPMPGATRAILEPWRNTYAQLATHLGWPDCVADYADLPLTRYLQGKPLDTLAVMLERGLNSPLTSSCGRLFDAVAGALGVAVDAISYEGQAAIELEALALPALASADTVYAFAEGRADGIEWLDPAPMWRALLADLAAGVDASIVAARFHLGLAAAVAALAAKLARRHGLDMVALSGGVLQNKTLFEALERHLVDAGLDVLSHRLVPANDGGLALGQAVVAAARRAGSS